MGITEELSDVWADDTETFEVNPHADLERSSRKQGYLDGITKAHEASLQTGFDDGYPLGAEIGILVGKILVTINSNCDKETFERAKLELNISKVMNRKFFDKDLQLSEHQLLQHWNDVALNSKL